jgi:hypothetical protein
MDDLMNQRIHVGHHLRVIDDTGDAIALEGYLRLRPGQIVDLVLSGAEARRALVLTWAVTRLGRDGTTYKGICRWQ